MEIFARFFVIFFVILFFASQPSLEIESCNEVVCASIVSKCLLTQACKCDLQNCTCCKDCSRCLDKLWTECCSCIELCTPSPKRSNVSTISTIEDLPNPLPSLFNSLVLEPDGTDRWFTLTFPIDYEISSLNPELRKEITLQLKSNETKEVKEQETFKEDTSSIVTFNCSVAYMSQCMPLNKCRAACQSMGALSYRWFHDGCCECVGELCRNYGLNNSRCLQCPSPEVVLPANMADLDYAENDESL